MTDMNDGAKTSAEEVWQTAGNVPQEYDLPAWDVHDVEAVATIATALRKAKADGMREAADIFDEGKGIRLLGEMAKSEFSRHIYDLASQLEPMPPPQEPASKLQSPTE